MHAIRLANLKEPAFAPSRFWIVGANLPYPPTTSQCLYSDTFNRVCPLINIVVYRYHVYSIVFDEFKNPHLRYL